MRRHAIDLERMHLCVSVSVWCCNFQLWHNFTTSTAVKTLERGVGDETLNDLCTNGWRLSLQNPPTLWPQPRKITKQHFYPAALVKRYFKNYLFYLYLTVILLGLSTFRMSNHSEHPNHKQSWLKCNFFFLQRLDPTTLFVCGIEGFIVSWMF